MRARRVLVLYLLSLPWASLAAASTLKVAVYNYAGISSAELQAAEVETSRYFRPADINFVWLQCQARRWRRASCPADIGPRALVLDLLPRDMASPTLTEGALGYAWPGTKIAGVLCAPVGELADEAQMPRFEVMGMVMAHEIGHLLLGPHSHARRGIMEPNWEASRLRSLRRGPYFEAGAERRLAAAG